MPFLLRRIRLGDYGSRLAQSEAGLTEQSLTLAYAKLDTIFLRDPGRQRFAERDLPPAVVPRPDEADVPGVQPSASPAKPLSSN
jgi:hypothetical protein